MCHLAQQDCSSPWPWCLSALLCPLSQVQLGHTLTHLAAASLCPEGCSELVSLPSVRGWCGCGVNVLCYSQAAHLCSPLLAIPPTAPSLLPHTCGCLSFSQSCTHAGITLLLVLLVERLLQPSSSHSPYSSPIPFPCRCSCPAHPFHGSRLCTTALCLVLGAPFFSPCPITPLSPGHHQ